MTIASRRGPALRDKGPGGRRTGSVGRFVVRRARLVLVAAMLAVIGFGVLGLGAFGKLQTGGFQDPGAESTTAQTLTDQRFGGSAGVVLLVHAEAGTVDDAPARAAAAEAARRRAAVPGVSNVVSYWQTRNRGLRSKDGKYALILGSTKSDRNLSSPELASLRSHSSQVEVTVGGSAAIGNDILTQVTKSLRTAEMIAVPIIQFSDTVYTSPSQQSEVVLGVIPGATAKAPLPTCVNVIGEPCRPNQAPVPSGHLTMPGTRS